MQHEPKPILDYSSPAEEEQRDRTADDERREAVERYNEATFGERRPIASEFVRIAVVIAIGLVLMYFLPRGIGRLVASFLVVVFVIWRSWKHGWPPKDWASLSRPWHGRWW